MKILASNVGEGLRQIRGDRKLREMKELLHLSVTHISYLEKGQKNPSSGVLEAYQKVLGETMILVFDE